MIKNKTPGRKDDLESLIYILCFLHCGTLPTIEFVNMHLDNFHMPQFLDKVLKFRIEKQEYCRERIKILLQPNIETAFQYIIQLTHSQKPDYGMFKLWLASNKDEELKALNSQIKINNEALANQILFQHKEHLDEKDK